MTPMHCNVPMVAGQAMAHRGYHPMAFRIGAVVLSRSLGNGNLVPCLKCPACGYSRRTE
jgi:hypothetical protein